MAYKDEYEVARLHLDPVERARIEAEFGEGAKVRYKLHPPVAARAGHAAQDDASARRRSRRCAASSACAARSSTRSASAKVRRVERALPAAYRALVERALEHAGAEPATRLRELCELPDMVRGYEDIKLGNVERFHARAAELLAALDEPVLTVRQSNQVRTSRNITAIAAATT